MILTGRNQRTARILMELQWVLIAGTVSGMLSGISLGFLKFVYSIDIVQFKLKLQQERKQILRDMVKKLKKTNETSNIEKVLDDTNKMIGGFDTTDKLVDGCRDNLSNSVYASIIGFVLVTVAAIMNDDDIHVLFLMFGGFSYFFGIICIGSGISNCNQLHKKHIELMLRAKSESVPDMQNKFPEDEGINPRRTDSKAVRRL